MYLCRQFQSRKEKIISMITNRRRSECELEEKPGTLCKDKEMWIYFMVTPCCIDSMREEGDNDVSFFPFFPLHTPLKLYISSS